MISSMNSRGTFNIFKPIYVSMAYGIDWKRSLFFSVILIGILYVLRSIIGTGEVYCISAIVIFAVFFLVVNLMGRRR